MRRFLALIVLAAPLSADPLTDVRTALSRLPAKQPIRVTYELQRNETQEGKLGNEKFNGKVSIDAEADASGVRVAYARPMLDQAFREQRAEQRDSKLTTPTASTLRQLDPLEVAESVDFSPSLLQYLEGATVKEDRTGTWQGKPARILVLRLLDEKSDASIGKVTVADNKLTLWLGADQVPLAAERLFTAKFSLLVIKGETRQKSSWHFATIGDRLVPVHAERTENSSGLGQKGSTVTIATVRVR